MLSIRYVYRCDADGCDVSLMSEAYMCPFPALWDRYVPNWDAVARPVLPKRWTMLGISAYCPKHTVTITVEPVKEI